MGAHRATTRQFNTRRSFMSTEAYPPKPADIENSFASESTYESMYRRSVTDNEGFWKEQALAVVDWHREPTKIKDVSYDAKDLHIRWFYDGKLNVCYNCIDRHLPEHKDRVAIIHEGDEPEDSQRITYYELYESVARLGNVLKTLGVSKGDRVMIYMPMIPEAAYAMLACARIGAVHSVVFGGFSPEALAGRIRDCKSHIVITADEGVRGGKPIPLKDNVDKALESCPDVSNVLVVRRTGKDIAWVKTRDHWYHDRMAEASNECPVEVMDAEDPLFILYTSGSTGKPKGVLHTQGGYLVYATMGFRYVFDYHVGEVFFCTADVGWVTGHSYMVYGPLANKGTWVMFEGVPHYPDFSRFWQICEKHRVNIFYTAPTAIRALMREGDDYVTPYEMKSLRLIATVGEPINPEAWRWFYKTIGRERCQVIDTWWQTETGGALITPLPGAMTLKPGSATRPFFGIQPVLVDDQGKILEGAAMGNLCMLDSWPGQMRTVFGDHQRFIDTYFKTFPGKYFTGDGARRDEDGDFWITGRVDDVLNVSGHRLGTAEIESALVLHDAVAEAAVVGFPHDIKGQGIDAFVSLKRGQEPSDALRADLIDHVRTQISSIAKPDRLRFTPALPKTRSGKIMRRILRKISAGEFSDFGDTSTLADPAVVSQLLETEQNAP